MSEKHTPLPWFTSGDEGRSIRSSASVVAMAGSMATDPGYTESERKPHVERAQHDAALIVRAVNCHAELVAALEAWRAFWDDMPKGQMGAIACSPYLLNEAFLKMDAALARAKVQP
jgi:hypothetical protein